jgi:GTPase
MSEHKTRKRVEPIDSTGLEELTVAVIGSVDSGKSTTIGTLVGGALDNGNGSARSIVFMHPHEHETGRTSDISYQYMKLMTNE